MSEDYTFFYGQGNADHQLGTCFLVCKKIESAFRKVWFISDRLTYIILRGRCFNIVVLNVHSHMKIRGMR
jgi:hypothetical protein